MKDLQSPQPEIQPEMTRPDFWIDRITDADKVILKPPAIDAYNQKLLQCLAGTIYDLPSYPESLEKHDLQAMITQKTLPAGPVYRDGKPLSPDDLSQLQARLNIDAIPEVNPVAYGFTLRRANLRSFPIAVCYTAEPDDVEFDLFQETALNPAEPLLILHRTAAADWYYIQTANFRGWVASQDIIATEKRQAWLSYIQSCNFLVVAANHLQVFRPDETGNTETLHFEMGAKLPLEDSEVNPEYGDFLVKIPARDAAEHLCFQPVRIPRSDSVNRGFLPYTGGNMINQAFKMLGQRYGWGGTHKSVDCSSFTMNIYHSFGFLFPRNSWEQERLPGTAVHFEVEAEPGRAARMNQLCPGAILNLPGHVMLYLGEYKGSHYIIHALSSYGIPNSRGGYTKTYILKVCVTGLDLIRSNGKTLLASLSSGRNIE
jgi:hypothetical protein